MYTWLFYLTNDPNETMLVQAENEDGAIAVAYGILSSKGLRYSYEQRAEYIEAAGWSFGGLHIANDYIPEAHGDLFGNPQFSPDEGEEELEEMRHASTQFPRLYE